MIRRGLPLLFAAIATTARAAPVPRQVVAQPPPAAAPGVVVEDAIPGSHIEAPVALAFTPDGRLLVADVPGRVWVIQNGVQLPTPMWAHENEVEINGDCGLLGMTLDPDFANNRRIYLLYAVDPDSNGVDDDSVHFGRLVRYEVSSTNPNLVDESTRTVLFGAGWADGVPVASGTHSVGALRFAGDGTLLVSMGEGANYDSLDAGGRDPAMFAPGRAPLAWDRGAFRSQQLDCPGGKLLRIDPGTGRGLPSNPFWNGDPDATRSKVWAYGLRNPFRFCVRPGTGLANAALGNPGALYLSDVGWNRWEEIDVAKSPGTNFGWPCWEGNRPTPGYQDLSPAFGGCAAMESWDAPAMAISHVSADSSQPAGLRGNAATAGLFYAHTQFPPPWRGRLMFGDFLRGWVSAAVFDGAQRFVTQDVLATGMNGPVDFAVEPATGWLYVACIIDDHVRRIRWSPAAQVGPAVTGLALSRPTPNPASGGADFSLALPEQARVSFEVVDLSGRRVWAGPEREHAAGVTLLRWDGRDAAGREAAPGVYLARVRVGGVALARRVTKLR